MTDEPRSRCRACPSPACAGRRARAAPSSPPAPEHQAPRVEIVEGGRAACAGSTSSARARSSAPGSRSTSTSTRSTTRTSPRATSGRRSTSTTTTCSSSCTSRVYDKQLGRLNAAELDIFVGPDYVITIPNQPLQPLDYLFERCRANEELREQLFAQGLRLPALPDRRRRVDASFPMLRKIGNKLERARGRHLRGPLERGRARHLQRQAGDHQLPQGRPPACARRSRDLERTTKRYLAEDLDDLLRRHQRRLRAHLGHARELQGGRRGARGARTSRCSRTSSTTSCASSRSFSVVLLPLTLIASIFGMNVQRPRRGRHQRLLDRARRDGRRCSAAMIAGVPPARVPLTR